ncbi:MAG: flippase-like domain-containing protein [Chitinivibrionales bacterium]|nr:flippase-like domain-containing protein [Chitinivibrionales bacterium]
MRLPQRFIKALRHMPPSQKKTVTWFFRVAVTLLFLCLVNKNVTGNQVRQMAAMVDWRFIALSAGLSVTGLWLQIIRWKTLITAAGFSISLKVSSQTILWGHLLGFITPGRFGEMVRTLPVSSVSPLKGVFLVCSDKLFALSAILSICCVAGVVESVFFHSINQPIVYAFLCISSAGAVSMVLVLIPAVHDLVRRHLRHCTSGSSWGCGLLDSVPTLNTAAGRRCLLYSLIIHLLLLAQTALLFSMVIHPNPAQLFCGLAYAYSAMLFLPVSLGNMGVREGFFFYFLSRISLHTWSESAVSLSAACFGVSLLILIMNIIVPSLAGLFWFLMDSPHKKRCSNDRTSEL